MQGVDENIPPAHLEARLECKKFFLGGALLEE
jgi:hypothetical protein